MLNRTGKKEENNRGEINKKDLRNEIYPAWQGLQDDYRTYCCIASFLKNRSSGQ